MNSNSVSSGKMQSSNRLVANCARCGKAIPADAQPNSEYVLLGMDKYHRACYLQHIGLSPEVSN